MANRLRLPSESRPRAFQFSRTHAPSTVDVLMKKSVQILGAFLILALGAGSANAASRFFYGTTGCSGGGGTGYWAQQGTGVGQTWKTTDDGICSGQTFWLSTDDAIFGGAAGTVTVRFSANHAANSIRVKTTGYKFWATAGSAATMVLNTG